MATTKDGRYIKAENYIGIDPGVSNGLAIWNVKEKRLTLVETYSFWELIQSLEVWVEKKISFEVKLEDPNFIKTSFRRDSNIGISDRKAQNIGSVKRTADLIREYCEWRKITVYRIPPTSAKWKKEYFRQVTKYEGRVSQHGIDAAKLVYGI